MQCGSIENLHIDHIIPICRGGLDDESNKQVLCRTCNLKKGRGVDYSKHIKRVPGANYLLTSQSFLDLPTVELRRGFFTYLWKELQDLPG